MTARWGDERLPPSFWDKVAPVPEAGCWLWLGFMEFHGYGQVKTIPFRGQKAHRVAYHVLVGAIPANLECDHLCRVRCCCNPDHIELVTHAENVRRSHPYQVAASFNRRKLHCPAGHSYDAANTHVCLRTGQRHCRICNRERALARYHQRKEAQR